MPKPYFSLSLDVVKKPCLVIGGDGEALEKSERLVEAQAELLVVGRKCIPELVEFCSKHRVPLELRNAEKKDIRGRFFVLNCVKTDAGFSEWVYKICLDEHAIISAYDQPDFSNAVMQALVRAGKMRLGIGSGGATPGLAGALRRELEKLLNGEFPEFADWVIAEREEAIRQGKTPKERKAIFKELLKDFAIEGKLKYPKEYDERKSTRSR